MAYRYTTENHAKKRKKWPFFSFFWRVSDDFGLRSLVCHLETTSTKKRYTLIHLS